MTYSPKRAMAELRHSISMGARATSSPMKRDEDSSPFISDTQPQDDDDGRGRPPFKDRDRPFLSYFQSICPSISDDSNSSRISLFIVIAVAILGLVSILAIVKRVNAPYLCKKDGITLHCPHVKETPSLWENPYSATTSWKPCAERRLGGISDLPPENETTGYIFIHAEGGLNQQRIAVRSCSVMLFICSRNFFLLISCNGI
ncbi:hypothetical protein ACFX2I_011560 [Malus domestica]